MSDSSTTRLIQPYLEESTAPMFLSGFFQSPPENFFNSEKIEYDIMRDQEDVAVPLPDMTNDARENEASKYTNKGLTPPIFDEAITIAAFDQTHRQPGETPFQDPNFIQHAIAQTVIGGHRIERKLRRSIELMAGQVLQSGVITLVDSAGVTMFTIDFSMQSSHKVTTTAWAADGSTGNPIADIDSLAQVIRQDGKKNPSQLVMGGGAFRHMLANADVKTRIFNNYNSPTFAQLAPTPPGSEEATFQGYLWVGNYKFEIWTYAGFYKHPQTGTLTPYIDDNKVIVRAPAGRMDMCFGRIPLIVPPDARAMQFMPPRIQDPTRGLDLSVNAWITPNNKHVKVSFGTRAIPIPTAIDTYGCLTVF